MTKTKAKQSFTRIRSWADRFNTPTVAQLAGELPAAAAALLKTTRKMLHEAGLTTEVAQWRGECWKWTIEFRTASSRETGAILIPAPENLQLAIPVDVEFINSLPMKRLKKAVREGLELAAEPFDTNLAVWSVSSTGLVSDLADLLQRRSRLNTRRTG